MSTDTASSTSAVGGPPTKVPARGYVVLFAGLLSNFSVGILYTWSNIRDVLAEYPEWATSQLTIPYSIGGMVFAALLIVAGSLQDKVGPRKVMIGGVLAVGLSTIASGLVTRVPALFFLTFGFGVGAGLAFVYACPRPAAMKWFDPSKKGMINGIVVAGFGLGALWLGPTEILLLERMGFSLERTLITLGIIILAIGIPCAFNVVNPPAGYVPPKPKRDESKPIKDSHVKAPSVALKTTVRTKQAWMLMGIYALYCSAGAVIISSVTDILKTQTPGGETGQFAASLATLLPVMVPVVALSNATGRGSGGVISDFLGRRRTYMVMHIALALNMFMFQFYLTPTMIVFGVVITAILYGAGLSVTPSIVADYFGLKNYGANYGFVYYGWGMSLIIGPQIGSSVKAATGSYIGAYYAILGLIAISFVLVLLLKQPKFRPDQITDEPEIVDPKVMPQPRTA